MHCTVACVVCADVLTKEKKRKTKRVEHEREEKL